MAALHGNRSGSITTTTPAGRRPSASASPQAARSTRQRRRKLLTGMVCLLLVVGAFLGGFFLRADVDLMEKLGIPTGIPKEDVNPGMTVQGDTRLSISAQVAEVEGIVQLYSMDSYDLDTMTAALMKAFVDTTEDPYFRYFSPERYESFVRESVTGVYAGIGVLFGEREGQAYAVDVFEGGVAAVSGVQYGDFVVAIDGDRSQEWTQTEVQNAIGQCAGGTIVITWRRPVTLSDPDGEEFTTTLVVSDTASEPNVSFYLEDQVGYIQVKQLSSTVVDNVKKAIEALEANGAEAYVLDLRNCSGGYLNQAVDLVDLFVRNSVIVQIQTKQQAISTRNASNTVLTDKPLVLLVNGSTSAAAEVVAAALHDTGRATIIGVRTQGKGSVQVFRPLTFGGALRYTAAYYKSPKGLDIDRNGVTPDVTVADAAQQKAQAIGTASSMIPEERRIKPEEPDQPESGE